MTYHFNWGESKAIKNIKKHGIAFELAAHVFDDELHITTQDRDEDGELRWQTIGMVGGCFLLLVAHTFLDDEGIEVIRIISARKATSKERKFYERQNY